ncbi:MAG: modulator of DNA gyrase [Spirochaetes bacterium]|nr:MAG: modulator of DNA gyrase [Spirochaetota bacterium]
MMKEKILATLAAAGISDWRLVRSALRREERYFVGSALEQARSVDEEKYSLTVYVDSESEGKKYRGEATVSLQPSLSSSEIQRKISVAAMAASKSKNPYFELPGPSESPTSLPPSGFSMLGRRSRIEIPKASLFAAEKDLAPQARINSLELFVTQEEREFLNSKGQAFASSGWKGYSEFFVEAVSPSGPVELFDDVEFSEPDALRLAQAVGDRLAQVVDRTRAKPLPNVGRIPVILRGKEAEELFGWFFDNATTSMVFMKASTFALGANVQLPASPSTQSPASSVRDPLEIWAEPCIPGLAASAAFDPDGYPLERRRVLKDGILETFTGSIRHADWLGVQRTGAYSLFSVAPGPMKLEAMRAKPHLEPLLFSDFRLDTVTGDFGAEIRLAYWFDGKERIPVTGGSISGSMVELRPTMVRSAERALASRSLCPVAVLLDRVSITSAV